MSTVISVEHLSKSYRLGMIGGSTLREDLSRWWAQVRQRPDPNAKIGEEHPARHRGKEFWALHDVSFTVKEGEILGIIGRNGAGKSTLLKILSRVTGPTSGQVKIKGRIASLLEVGTGFHPELTGRENVFLNGTILGMTKAEIRHKLDEIIAFAEIDEFIDTPVKRYSSGMYVRLAFAVAAHLEPEILIVDEVLAVGDAQFQKKCLGKMKDVAGHGRTVLFVSHNLPSTRELCGSALLLGNGEIQEAGDCRKVIASYLGQLSEPKPLAIPRPPLEIMKQAYVTGTVIETPDGQPKLIFFVGESWQCRVQCEVATAQKNLVLALGIVSSDGTPVQTVWSEPRSVEVGAYEVSFRQDSVILATGSYTILVGLTAEGKSLQQFEAARIEIENQNEAGAGPFQKSSGVGYVLNSMRVDWSSVGPVLEKSS